MTQELLTALGARTPPAPEPEPAAAERTGDAPDAPDAAFRAPHASLLAGATVGEGLAPPDDAGRAQSLSLRASGPGQLLLPLRGNSPSAHTGVAIRSPGQEPEEAGRAVTPHPSAALRETAAATSPGGGGKGGRFVNRPYGGAAGGAQGRRTFTHGRGAGARGAVKNHEDS